MTHTVVSPMLNTSSEAVGIQMGAICNCTFNGFFYVRITPGQNWTQVIEIFALKQV